MVGGYKSDDEYSVISDRNDIGFIDFENCKNACSYSPDDESDVVSISVPFPMVKGKPRSGLAGETIVDTITIQNKTDEPLELWYVRIYDAKPEGSFTLSLMQPPTATSSEDDVQLFMESFEVEDRVLQPNRALTIWLSCKPKGIGLHTSAVHISVGDDIIERVVFVMAEDKISRSLASTKPFNYVRKKKKPIVDVSSAEPFVVGSRPVSAPNRAAKNGCSLYPIPVEIRQMIEQQQIPDVIQCELTMQNYVQFFHTLLALEEIKMEESMREYDLERITLKKGNHQYLWLEVPGLAEKRPSLVHGDYIFAKLSSEIATENVQEKKFQGYIHNVQAEEVALKFRDDFHQSHQPGNLYNVQFTYNRVGIRRLYQAIEAAQQLHIELLFPSLSYRKRKLWPAPLIPISRTLNQEQVSAVEMILGCRGGSPYVIHGPPGTGKTMTLIEAILQLYTGQQSSRVLVCAPSNSAADHILEKIISQEAVDVQNRDILRLNAVSRSPDDVDVKYLEFCCIDDNDIFTCPPLRELKRFRIIISTYTSTHRLHTEGIKRGHFSHIFLDEAGQASEPETMISVAHLCNGKTVVTLAGDPQQLGPLIFSRISEDFGLGKSFLERLFEDPFYANGNRNYMTRLVRNYRSHEKILDLPSKMFYGGELVACRKEEGLSAPFLEILPNKGFPLLFFGLQGCDEREGNNPSWFNRIEVSKVVEIIIDLIDSKGLCEDDIGVITPYRQQVQKIRTGLEMFGKHDIQVGSVEQFQGQEKKVIVVSTVRSTIKHNEFDKIHYLGFLSNPRRFNVAITRAKSLLILVGNPHIICKDEYWNELLWYCSDNEAYQGCFLPAREVEIVEEECSAPAPYSGYEGENVDPGYTSWDDKDTPASHADNDLKLEPAQSEDYKGKRVERGYNSWYDTGSSAHYANYEGGKVEPGYNSWEVTETPADHEGEQASNALCAQDIPEPVFDESEWSDGWK